MKQDTNLYAISAPNPTIMRRLAVDKLPHVPVVIEAGLSLLANKGGHGIFMTSTAHALGYLLPSSIGHEIPLQVIALNTIEESKLTALALEPVYCMNMSTVDKLQNHTFIWFGKENQQCAAVSALQNWKKGPILRLFVTPLHAILVRDEIGEELFEDFCTTAMCAGSNYNPYIWTDAELAEAKQNAELRGVPGIHLDFDQHQICLVPCAFDEARLAKNIFSIPESFPAKRYISPLGRDGGNIVVRHRQEDDTYFLDSTVSHLFTRIEICMQIARAIAVKCLQDMMTSDRGQSKQETLNLYFKQAQLLDNVTRAEACWAVCKAAEQLGWNVPTKIAHELEQYNRP